MDRIPLRSSLRHPTSGNQPQTRFSEAVPAVKDSAASQRIDLAVKARPDCARDSGAAARDIEADPHGTG